MISEIYSSQERKIYALLAQQRLGSFSRVRADTLYLQLEIPDLLAGLAQFRF
jgi:hypothetical protein